MKSGHKTLLAGVALATVFAAPALAQYSKPAATATKTDTTTTTTTTTTANATWADLDTNKDGNLSKDEAAKNVAMAAIFDKADANADGILTGDEYRAYSATPPADDGQKQ